MTSIQINYFLSLAECGSFSMTADMHYVTQPVVSKQISALEQELSLRLFIRGSRRTVLTKAGEIMYEHFKSVDMHLSEAIKNATEAQNAQFGHVCIGLTYSPDYSDIDKELLAIRRRYPEAKISVTNQILPIWPSEVRSGRYDVAITEFTDHTSFRDLQFVRLSSCKEYLVYSESHPLAVRKNLSMKDFETADFMFLMADSETKFPIHRFAQLCRRNHLSSTPKYFFTDSIELMDEMIRTGRFVSIRKEPRPQDDFHGLCLMDIDSELPLGLSFRADNKNPLVKDFVDALMTRHSQDELNKHK